MITRDSVVAFGCIVLVLGACRREAESKPRPNTTERQHETPDEPPPSPPPSPPPPGVRGTVRGPDAVIAGARVCAWPTNVDSQLVDADLLPSTIPCALADAAGHFVLELDSGVYRLITSARSYEAAAEWVTLSPARPSLELESHLVPGGHAHAGVLLDLAGEPLAGIEISLYDFRGLGHAADHTTTDARGRFELWGRPAQPTFVFHAPGYVQSWAIHTPQTPAYTLVPESSIAGQVIDAEGKPVANARVSVRSWSPYHWSMVAGISTGAVRTDADGRFRLGTLAPNEYEIFASANGRITGLQSVALGYAEHQTGLSFALNRPHREFVAEFATEANEPLGNCIIMIQADRTYHGWSDERGEVRLPLPSDDAIEVVAASCPGHYTDQRLGELEPSTEASLRLRFRPGHTVELRVLDGRGQPLAHANVFATPPSQVDWTSSYLLAGYGRSDESGVVRWSGLPPYAVDVTVFHWEASIDHPLRIDPQVAVNELALPLAGRIEVELAEPVGVDVVEALDCSEHPLPGFHASYEAALDADGRAVFEHLPPGTYELRPELGSRFVCERYRDADERSQYEPARVEVQPFTTARVALEAIEAQMVRVVDTSGTSVAGAIVVIGASSKQNKPRPRWDLSTHLARTNAEGLAHVYLYDRRTTFSAFAPGRHGSVHSPEGELVTVVIGPMLDDDKAR